MTKARNARQSKRRALDNYRRVRLNAIDELMAADKQLLQARGLWDELYQDPELKRAEAAIADQLAVIKKHVLVERAHAGSKSKPA